MTSTQMRTPPPAPVEPIQPTGERFIPTGTADPTVESLENFTSISEDYEDQHVRLCALSRTLTVKHWLLTHPALDISLDKIIYVLPATNAATKSGIAAWGLGSTGVGWARDFKRAFPRSKSLDKSYVCKYRESWLGHRVGFTVEDPARFLQTLERLLPGITTKALEQVYPGLTKLGQAEQGKPKRVQGLKATAAAA